jgi:hypothetical protein
VYRASRVNRPDLSADRNVFDSFAEISSLKSALIIEQIAVVDGPERLLDTRRTILADGQQTVRKTDAPFQRGCAPDALERPP